MLKICKGEPWTMWPDNIVSKFIDNPANRIFEHEGNFIYHMRFELLEPIVDKATLFSKLPNYFGIDMIPNGCVLLYSYKNNIETYSDFKECFWEEEKIYDLYIEKKRNNLKITLNGIVFFDIDLITSLASNDNSHIVFAAGNFPKNGFNLNYVTYNLHYLSIIRDGVMISEHTFEEFIHGKSFDLTDNCNFIFKI
jgi:hypothetical protein